MHAIQKVQHGGYEVMIGATRCADGVIRVSATCEGGGSGVRSYFRFSSLEPSVEQACARAIRDVCSLIDEGQPPAS